MREIIIFISFFILPITAIDRPRGVSLEKASFYQLDTEFRCLSNGKVIPADHVNDDYCDCEDGSDEPGTSACANGLFYCENKPYKGHYLKSSRVNDGICDCCDGSDEYSGIISCPNQCVEKYEQAKIEQEALRHQQSEGYKVKQEYMQQGKRARDEKVSKLSELEREKELLIKEKDAAEAVKNEAEEPEKIALEEHKKAWELVKEERQKAKDALKAAYAFSTLDANSDGNVDYPELMKQKEFDIDSDGTVSEEEAKEYLEESEQVDLTVFTEKIWPNIKEIYKPQEEGSPDDAVPAEEGQDNQETGEEEEKDPAVVEGTTKDIPVDVVEGGLPDHHDNDDNADIEDFNDDGEEDEEEDDEDEESAYDISKQERKSEQVQRREEAMKKLEIMRKNKKEMETGNTNDTESLDADTPEEDKEPEHSEDTKRLIEVADEARNKFNDAESKLKDHEREISDIKKYLEIDLGPNQEFAPLKDQCFEYTDREYTYRLCPFEKSTQKSKNGGIETSLGLWGKWHGPDDDKYDTMKYENGQGCWNGPSRSTHVNLHCGSVNEVTSASEPSRCEYQFEFTTPAICEPPKPLDVNDVHDEL